MRRLHPFKATVLGNSDPTRSLAMPRTASSSRKRTYSGLRSKSFRHWIFSGYRTERSARGKTLVARDWCGKFVGSCVPNSIFLERGLSRALPRRYFVTIERLEQTHDEALRRRRAERRSERGRRPTSSGRGLRGDRGSELRYELTVRASTV